MLSVTIKKTGYQHGATERLSEKIDYQGVEVGTLVVRLKQPDKNINYQAEKK